MQVGEASITAHGVEFAKPTVRVRSRMLERAWAWRKSRYADNLRMAGKTDEQVLDELERLDWNKRPTESLLIRWAAEEDGQVAMLEDMAVGDAAAVIDGMTEDERFDLVCDLWGWQRGGAQADPQQPASPTPETTTTSTDTKTAA